MSTKAARCAVLADRHLGLTEGIRGLLETQFEVVVMVADEPSLFETTARLAPALVVVDLSLVRQSSLDWLSRLHASYPEVRVIVLSIHDEPSVMVAVRKAGADGFVLKRAIAAELLEAVDTVLAGRQFP